MKKKFFKALYIAPLLTIASIGCQPDEFEGSNGLIGPDLDPSFTIDPVEVDGKINNYQFSLNESNDVLAVFWDLGEGTLIRGMEETDVTFFPDADTYTIKTKIVGRGGEAFESEQELVIPTSDPKYGNLLRGGRLNDGNDEFWSTKQYSGGVLPTFSDGKVVFNYGDWAQSGIYQSFEAEAGKKYRIDMTVSGQGATDTWFEVYIGRADPATFVGDYNDGGIRLALNTWAGCGKTKFADKLTKLSCAGSAEDGVFEAAASGTHYIVIRTGGANLGAGGIAVDNIEIRPYFDEE